MTDDDNGREKPRKDGRTKRLTLRVILAILALFGTAVLLRAWSNARLDAADKAVQVARLSAGLNACADASRSLSASVLEARQQTKAAVATAESLMAGLEAMELELDSTARAFSKAVHIAAQFKHDVVLLAAANAVLLQVIDSMYLFTPDTVRIAEPAPPMRVDTIPVVQTIEIRADSWMPSRKCGLELLGAFGLGIGVRDLFETDDHQTVFVEVPR